MLRVFDHSETLPKDTGDALGFAVVCERVSHIIATEQTVERERRVTSELKACHGAPENRPPGGASRPASEHDVNSHDRTRLGVGESHVGPNSSWLR